MTEPDLSTLWVYLSASPLLGLTVTLLAYSLAYKLYERLGTHPLVHPVDRAVRGVDGLAVADQPLEHAVLGSIRQQFRVVDVRTGGHQHAPEPGDAQQDHPLLGIRHVIHLREIG